MFDEISYNYYISLGSLRLAYFHFVQFFKLDK